MQIVSYPETRLWHLVQIVSKEDNALNVKA